MFEQFIVNDVELDVGNSVTQMVFQSPLFTDLDNIVSNRTNSVDFPLSDKNLKAIGYSHIPQTESDYMYRKHRAIYLRDGVQIFSGVGYVLSITQSVIRMTFTWGNISAFKDLTEMRLQDLQDTENPADYIRWDNVMLSQRFDYGLNNGGYPQRQLPIMSVNEVIDRIASKSGVSILRGTYFDDLRLPLVTKFLDSKSNEDNAVDVRFGKIEFLRNPVGAFQRFYAVLGLTTRDIDVQGQYLGNGVFDVEETTRVHIRVNAGVTISFPMASPSMSICACTEDGEDMQTLLSIPSEYYRVSGFTRNNKSFNRVVFVKEWSESINVENYSYICFVFTSMASSTREDENSISGVRHIRIINSDDAIDGEVAFGGSYPLYRNLPDWSCGEFIKNVMKMVGVFAYAEDERTIRFFHPSYLYTMRSQAYNWSDRVQLVRGMANEVQASFGSYAQRNICKYEDDEDVTTDYNGVIVIDNQTLDEESEMLSVGFGACQDDMIPLWSKNDIGEWEFNSGCLPRIMRSKHTENPYNQEEITFRGLEWWNIIREHYSEVQAILRMPKSIKVTLELSINDVLNIDLRIPVYLQQFARYYAIIKLTTKDSRMAEAELLCI